MFDNCFAIRTVAFLDALKSKVTFFSYLDKFLLISLFYPLLLKKICKFNKKMIYSFLEIWYDQYKKFRQGGTKK